MQRRGGVAVSEHSFSNRDILCASDVEPRSCVLGAARKGSIGVTGSGGATETDAALDAELYLASK